MIDGQVMTVDLPNKAVTAAKVKDGQIKAAEIASDVVGAAGQKGKIVIRTAQSVLHYLSR